MSAKQTRVFMLPLTLAVMPISALSAQSVKDYERAALERARREQAEGAAAERRAQAAAAAAERQAQEASAREANRRAIEQGRAAEARRRAEREALAARREAARREAAQKARQEIEDEARRQALREAEQRQLELQRLNELNARNRRTELEAAARGGDAQAAMALAAIHERGESVPVSANEASHWYKLAAELGDSRAQLWYVRFVTSSGNENSDPVILKYLISLSDANDPVAQFYLSKRYLTGAGVPQDKLKALALLKSSADAGYVEAQAAFGMALQNGSLGRKDYKLSLSYLQMAEIQGSTSARMNLGIAYENGFGVKKDRETAFNYYKRVLNTEFRQDALERIKFVDPFSYPGKIYENVPRGRMEMNCPAVNAYIKLEDGIIKEYNDGSYLNYGTFKKENGRNIFKYGIIIKTIIDFDQRKYFVSGLGSAVYDCE